METHHRYGTVFLVGCVVYRSLTSASEPPPTPTPRPTTLAAVARTTQLTRPGTLAANDPIVITDDNLSELADGAVVTEFAEPAVEFVEPSGTPAVDPKIRRKWRKLVMARRADIGRLEARRETVEAEIDRLERGRLDSKTLDRIERAEAKLRLLDTELARERAELSRIVRAARKEGAEPGWFR